jgi:hypothetical protein
MGAGAATTAATGDDEPSWEYHVGSMGRQVALLLRFGSKLTRSFAAHFKGRFLMRKWRHGSSRLCLPVIRPALFSLCVRSGFL